VCFFATTTRTWRWNISCQVQLISGLHFCHRKTVCAGRRRIQRTCVSSPPRPALGAGTFQARCGSFQDLDRQTNRPSELIYRIASKVYEYNNNFRRLNHGLLKLTFAGLLTSLNQVTME
jgi:hypothetical protein